MTAFTPLEIPAEDTVSVRALPRLLDDHPDVKVLSLDCFDTLLWRRVHKPTDVFFGLQQRPAFARAGLDAGQRQRGEQLARRMAFVRTGGWEVSLRDILRTAAPGLDDASIAEIEEEELQAECEACFPLPAAIALLRDAAARGIPVAIVSDTYLREAQLRRLLAHCLPADAYAAIDRVFVSCEHGASKGTGLFERLCRAGALSAADTLHVGDNPDADLRAPLQAGLRARVLHRFPKHVAHRMEDQGTALRLVDPEVERSRGMPSPWHAVYAQLELDGEDAARDLGQVSLGPMMHGFASWILARRREALAAGRRLKIAFLMRDGHLPWRACTALAGEEVGTPVYISRFTAFAAGFRSQEDIDRYLAMHARSRQYATLLKQFGITGAAADEILRKVERAGGGHDVFVAQVRAPATTQRILRWSAGFRERMRRHLAATLDLQPGDTLAMVDLGYFGNIQRALAPVMREEWKVDLRGWYLMCYPQAGDGGERTALIDRARHGEQAIRSLIPFMATLETLCTVDSGSVRDYAEDGTPVLEAQVIAPQQAQAVARIQEHAIAFVRAAAAHAPPCAEEALRDATLAELVRLLYLPTRGELSLFQSFSMDENMGSDTAVQIADPEQAIADLRRDGIFFSTRMRPKLRRNLAHELRHCGVELSLATLAVHRDRLSLRSSDWSLREDALPVLYTDARDATRQAVAAQYTYDGFCRARVPLGVGNAHVGLLFGERHRWLQLLEARVLPVDQLAGAEQGYDVRDRLLHDQLVDHGDGMLECASGSAFAMLPAGSVPLAGPLVLELVYRPIVARTAAVAEGHAA
ncbi:MAG TPA: HAD family hydrolase [Xanthomonadaceae bacterium]|nr:HAD family hydrolase [Xanthomonadaceae bacterium]